jgi:uncharacterized membrane protein
MEQVTELVIVILLIIVILNQFSIMNRQERLEAAVAKLDTATNEIAADLQTLKDEIAAGNVSDETLNQLDANIAKLEALGKLDEEGNVEEEA